MSRKRKEFNVEDWEDINEINSDTFNAYLLRKLPMEDIKPKGRHILFWMYDNKCYVINTYKVIRSRNYSFHLRCTENKRGRNATLKVNKQLYGVEWFVLYTDG